VCCFFRARSVTFSLQESSIYVPDLDFQLHMSWFVFIFSDLRAGCLLGDIGGIVDHHCSITGILSSLGWSTFIP
jgi:hypothetical protein